MRAELRTIIVASLVGGVLAGGGIAAGLAGFLLAGAGVAAMHLDGRASLPSPRAANPLLHQVRLKPEADRPHGVLLPQKHRIEAAVRAQIRAYTVRDAELAFAQLAPSIQRFFGEPHKFLRAIAQEVPAMLDTRRFAFLGVEQTGRRTVTQVLITDSVGQEWLAEFQLERLAGDDWRIKGCVLQAAPGQQA